MIPELDNLTETELADNASHLGNWHDVEKKGEERKRMYLVNESECSGCLKDLLIALKHDDSEKGYPIHLKLGDWQIVPDKLLPLLMAYRSAEDQQPIINPTIKMIKTLTTHLDVSPALKPVLLRTLQGYKEAFATKDVFVTLMGKLMRIMDDAETQGDDSGARESTMDVDMVDVIQIMCNLVSVPDPQPGDAGFTPLRKTLQKTYITYFIQENLLDVLLFFAEELEANQNVDHAWLCVEMLYHMITLIDPEAILTSRKTKGKKVLSELLERDQTHARLTKQPASRHARFGTVMHNRDAVGGTSVSASVSQRYQVSRGSKIWGQNFRNSEGSEIKRNLFYDPFFVDLEEGSVREHNQLNPYVRQSLGTTADLSDAVLTGLCKSLEEFLQSKFSAMVSFIRGTVLSTKPEAGNESASSRPYGRQILLNFISWFLEFHRYRFAADISKAKANKEEAPIIDISIVQGALDLDMIQFVTARLREYGKGAGIHSSFLVIVLRCLAQQIKTIDVVIDSADPETSTCGEILTTNLVKEDTMGHLVWIMKNFKSSVHDPRILSYTVEAFHTMVRLMKKTTKRQKTEGKVEFQVERLWGSSLRRVTTTVDDEIKSLADALVIENLFQLLEKYKRHSVQLNSMLVHLIYSVIRASPANIVVFFELSYFLRIHRIWSDPVVQDRREGKRYREMVELLQFILRQFFKCLAVNKCVFVELLFRKTFEKSKDALMDSHQSEFEAILDNYEDAEYARFLERMRKGEGFSAMRSQHRQKQDGSLPWTPEEDKVLSEQYAVYADHPLCFTFLAAALPEDNNRNKDVVRKRLNELGLIKPKASKKTEEDAENKPDIPEEEPPLKKAKVGDVDSGMPADNEGDDLNDVEMDLERLLDAAMDTLAAEETLPDPSSSTSGAMSSANPGRVNSGLASTNMDAEAETQPELDLELELENMLEESGSQPFESQDIGKLHRAQTQLDPSGTQFDAAKKSTVSATLPATEIELDQSLEAELDALLESQPSQAAPPASQPSPTFGRRIDSQARDQHAENTEQDNCDGDEEQFWEEAVNAERDNPVVAPNSAQLGDDSIQRSQKNGSSQEVPGTQDSTLENALERLIDDTLFDGSQSLLEGSQSQ